MEAASTASLEPNSSGSVDLDVTQGPSPLLTPTSLVVDDGQRDSASFKSRNEPPQRPSSTLSRRSSYQRQVSMSSSKPRRYHKHSRSGSTSMIASASSAISTPSTSTQSKRRRKRPEQSRADHGQAPASHRRPSSRRMLSENSISTSSALYKRPRAERNDRIRRQPRMDGPVQERVRSMVSPSLLSVLSALTSNTGSSSGSNVTVKPSPPHSSSRGSFSRDKSGVENARPPNELESVRFAGESQPKAQEPQQQINVFEFLEQDAAEPALTHSRQGPMVQFAPAAIDLDYLTTNSAPLSAIGPNTASKDLRDDNYHIPTSDPSFFFNSAKPVGGDNNDVKTQQTRQYRRSSVDSMPSKLEGAFYEGRTAKSNEQRPDMAPVAAIPNHVNPQARKSEQASSWQQHNGHSTIYTPYQTMLDASQERNDSVYSMYSAKSTAMPPPQELEASGYELLASKLSAYANQDCDPGEKLVPLYRRFESLNHRVLLHLQDEICELEEQLRLLENYIARVHHDMNGGSRRGSRREDAYYGDGLRYQRTDLLGRISVKLTTYNQALESYKSLVRRADTAKEDEILKYKEWLDRVQPVAENETNFLSHKSDLISISSQDAGRRSPSDTQPFWEGKISNLEAVHSDARSKMRQETAPASRWLKLGVPASMLLTFISFAIVPNYWARIFIMATFVSIGTFSFQLSEPDLDLSLQDIGSCVIVYASIMTILAGRGL